MGIICIRSPIHCIYIYYIGLSHVGYSFNYMYLLLLGFPMHLSIHIIYPSLPNSGVGDTFLCPYFDSSKHSLYKECSEKLARCRHHRNNNSESAYRISHDTIELKTTVITRVLIAFSIEPFV